MTTLARQLPPDHPLHRRLANEVHARPPVAIPCPGVASTVALWRQDASEADDFAPLCALAAQLGGQVPAAPSPHLVIDLPGLRVKWERHLEFTSYTFFRALDPIATAVTSAGLAWPESAFGALPPGWLAALPGRTIAAVDVVLLPGPGRAAAAVAPGGAASGSVRDPGPGSVPLLELVGQMFSGPTLVGSRVAGGVAEVFTDFELSADGRERWLVLDAGMTRGQQARVVQRLTEIAIYRITSLLAFPLARELGPMLSLAETRLAAATARIAELGHGALAAHRSDPPPGLAPGHDAANAAHARAAHAAHDGHAAHPPHNALDPLEVQREDRRLLDQLSQIAADIERSVATSAYRFTAARAYWDLVNNRVAELREQRIGGIATIGEFLSRRLAPAINTVVATARRQHDLAERSARAGDLLRTRVDVAREEQNQQILAAIDRRGKVALRMQQTVEGLSVAAITYYAAALVGYFAKAAVHIWPDLEPDWVTAAAIPVLALAIWRIAHRVRQELVRDVADPGSPGTPGSPGSPGKS